MKKVFLLSSLLFCFLVANAQFSGNGSGTSDDPYQITNADELFEVRNALDASYKLINDVDLTEWIQENNPTQGWNPINEFSGSLDGNGKSISGLYINRPTSDDVGLFGRGGGTVKNMRLVRPIINGHNKVGAIMGTGPCGSNNCVISPIIEGDSYVGGICGYTPHGYEAVSYQFVYGGTIRGTSYVGGVLGYFEGRDDSYPYSSYYITKEIKNNYCSALIIADSRVGGICGGVPSNYFNSSKKSGCSYLCAENNLFEGEIIASTYIGNILGYNYKDGYFNGSPYVALRYNIGKGKTKGDLYTNGLLGGSYAGANHGGITKNVFVADTISSKSDTPFRIVSLEGATNNYASIQTVVMSNNKSIEVEDNDKNGNSYGIKLLKKQTTYEGLGFDFEKNWTIIEGETFPYSIYQCSPATILSFSSGPSATITGVATGKDDTCNGKVYVMIGNNLYEGNVVDGHWSVQLGEVTEGQEAQVTVMVDGMMPSILAKAVAEKGSGGGTSQGSDEQETDISQLDNVIYLEKSVLQVGSTATLSFRMKNSAAIRGFQFDLYLPDGVTVVKNSKNKIQGALSSGRLPVDDEHTLTLVEQADHAIRFLCNSEYAETFTGNEGEIATLQIQIDEGMPNGDYPFVIKNMSLNEINASVYYNHNYVQTSLTVLGGKQCAKPTISYAGGKLTFTCETEGAICHSTITDTDIASYSSNEVQLGVTYNISVYATREGYADSEMATATLCWIDAEPRTEGLAEDAVTEVKALPVLIQTQGGTISVRGIDDGMEVSAYSVDGKKEGFAISEAGQAVVNTNLTSGSIAVIKIGEKAIKVQIK